MKKLIKIEEDFYVVVDDIEIKDATLYNERWCLEKGLIVTKLPSYYTDLSACRLITHSTKQLEGVILLSLVPIEKMLYGYSVNKLKADFANKELEQEYGLLGNFNSLSIAFEEGFKTHQELVKDKLFTIEDIKEALKKGEELSRLFGTHKIEERNNYINSILPKKEWNIEIDENNKMTLI